MKPDVKQLIVLVLIVAAGIGLTYLMSDGEEDAQTAPSAPTENTVGQAGGEQVGGVEEMPEGLHVVIVAPEVDAAELARAYDLPFEEPSTIEGGSTVFTTQVPDSLMETLRGDDRVQAVSRTSGGGNGEVEY